VLEVRVTAPGRIPDARSRADGIAPQIPVAVRVEDVLAGATRSRAGAAYLTDAARLALSCAGRTGSRHSTRVCTPAFALAEPVPRRIHRIGYPCRPPHAAAHPATRR